MAEPSLPDNLVLWRLILRLCAAFRLLLRLLPTSAGNGESVQAGEPARVRVMLVLVIIRMGSHGVLLLLPGLLELGVLLGLLVGRILTLFLIAAQQLHQPRTASRIGSGVPDCEVEAQLLDHLDAPVVAEVLPESELAGLVVWAVAVAGGGGLFGAAPGLLSVVGGGGEVEVLAAFAVGAVALVGEVDAGLGPVVAGDVGPVAYFVVEVGEGALDGREFTVWL